jgi:hypothetical protein
MRKNAMWALMSILSAGPWLNLCQIWEVWTVVLRRCRSLFHRNTSLILETSFVCNTNYCFWCAGGLWRCGLQPVHQACRGTSLSADGLLIGCPPSTPLYWQWNHDRMEWNRETACRHWHYSWLGLCRHWSKVSLCTSIGCSVNVMLEDCSR